MTTITIESIQAKQAELAEMIQQLADSKAAQGETIRLPETEITLKPGERYAGAVLDAVGRVRHHLVLMAQCPAGLLNWQDALNWAFSVGGRLPGLQEQALLYANCRPYLEPAWHWSCVADKDDDAYAWVCHFGDGTQYDRRKSYECWAVAIRTITVEV
jgi:hypothetical protein